MSEEFQELKGVIHYRHLLGDENYFRLSTTDHSVILCYFQDKLLPDVLKGTENELEESQLEVIVKGYFKNTDKVDDAVFNVELIEPT